FRKLEFQLLPIQFPEFIIRKTGCIQKEICAPEKALVTIAAVFKRSQSHQFFCTNRIHWSEEILKMGRRELVIAKEEADHQLVVCIKSQSRTYQNYIL